MEICARCGLPKSKEVSVAGKERLEHYMEKEHGARDASGHKKFSSAQASAIAYSEARKHKR